MHLGQDWKWGIFVVETFRDLGVAALTIWFAYLLFRAQLSSDARARREEDRAQDLQDFHRLCDRAIKRVAAAEPLSSISSTGQLERVWSPAMMAELYEIHASLALSRQKGVGTPLGSSAVIAYELIGRWITLLNNTQAPPNYHQLDVSSDLAQTGGEVIGTLMRERDIIRDVLSRRDA